MGSTNSARDLARSVLSIPEKATPDSKSWKSAEKREEEDNNASLSICRHKNCDNIAYWLGVCKACQPQCLIYSQIMKDFFWKYRNGKKQIKSKQHRKTLKKLVGVNL